MATPPKQKPIPPVKGQAKAPQEPEGESKGAWTGFVERLPERWQGAAKDSPFFAGSIVFHLLLIVVLGMITIAVGPARRKAVISIAEYVELEEDFIPPRAEDVEAIADPSAGEEAGSTPATAKADMPEVEIDDVDQIALRRVVSRGDDSDMSEELGDGMSRYGHSKAGDLRGAVDIFAIETLNSIEKGTTNVVFLVDESASIVYKDLPIIQKRMATYFRWIRLELKERYVDRGRWAIISYGSTAKVQQDLTRDLEEVEKGFSRIKADMSGRENVLEATNLCLSRFGGKAKFMLIAAVTDEKGDDTMDSGKLEATAARLCSIKARFFVFGREANWAVDDTVVKMLIKKQGKVKEYQCRASMGPETPLDEFFPGAWSLAGPRNLPSGFGMYGLNRLVQESNGMYFILDRESKWDMDRMIAYYRPDTCSRSEYETRCARSPLRAHLRKCWRDMSRCPGSGPWSRSADMKKASSDHEQHIRVLQGNLETLDRILASAPPDKIAPQRWLAHGELARACLLVQLHNSRAFATGAAMWSDVNNLVLPSDKEIITRNSGAPPAPAAKELDDYKTALFAAVNHLMKEHPQTPWAAMSARIRDRAMYFDFEVKTKQKPIPSNKEKKEDVPPKI